LPLPFPTPAHAPTLASATDASATRMIFFITGDPLFGSSPEAIRLAGTKLVRESHTLGRSVSDALLGVPKRE
jgi:hypothetical protein